MLLIWALCVCVFLLFHIFVDFHVPLASTLGQIRPISIDFVAIFVRYWYELSNDEGGNDKTMPPFGKTFLRTSGMRASALN